MKEPELDMKKSLGDKDWKKMFPFLVNRPQLVYLDSAATTPKPKEVIESMNTFYNKYSLNSHSETSNPLFTTLRRVVESTRDLIIRAVGGNSREEAVFVPSATLGLNFLALSCQNWLKPGDKIGITYLEHSSNCYPWEAVAKATGAEVYFLSLDNHGLIDLESLAKDLNSSFKVISVAHINNSLGGVNSLESIGRIIKEKSPECLFIVDACQSLSLVPILASKWKIDALVFSAHKIYGPTGLGVMWVNQKVFWRFPGFLWGGGKQLPPGQKDSLEGSFSPFFLRWEVGSLPLAQVFGLKKSLEMLQKKTKKTLEKTFFLRKILLKKMLSLKLFIYNLENNSSTFITFNFPQHHPHDVADYLAKNDVVLRAGNFCCPYLKKVIKVESALRVSLSFFNTAADVERLFFFLKKITSLEVF